MVENHSKSSIENVFKKIAFWLKTEKFKTKEKRREIQTWNFCLAFDETFVGDFQTLCTTRSSVLYLMEE